jgi:hypothetical protein
MLSEYLYYELVMKHYLAKKVTSFCGDYLHYTVRKTPSKMLSSEEIYYKHQADLDLLSLPHDQQCALNIYIDLVQ